MLYSLVTTWRKSSYSCKPNTDLLEKSGIDQQLISPNSIKLDMETGDENTENRHLGDMLPDSQLTYIFLIIW